MNYFIRNKFLWKFAKIEEDEEVPLSADWNNLVPSINTQRWFHQLISYRDTFSRWWTFRDYFCCRPPAPKKCFRCKTLFNGDWYLSICLSGCLSLEQDSSLLSCLHTPAAVFTFSLLRNHPKKILIPYIVVHFRKSKRVYCFILFIKTKIICFNSKRLRIFEPH